MNRRAGVILLIAAAFSVSCNDEPTHQEATTMKTLEASQDAKQLAALMQLPGTPLNVRWVKTSPQKSSPVGPSDFSLLAVVDYGPSGVAEMVQKMGPPSDNETLALSVAEANALFSDEVVKGFKKLDAGLLEVTGKLFGPELFVKTPFSQGKVVAVSGTSLLLVRLFTS